MVVGAHQDALLADRPFLDYIAVKVNDTKSGEFGRDGLSVVVNLEESSFFNELRQNKSPALTGSARGTEATGCRGAAGHSGHGAATP